MAEYQTIKIADIDRRPEAQIRSAMNPQAVKDYRDLIEDGAEFDPVEVVQFEDGSNVLADGWHRVSANEKAGRDKVRANITQGSMADVLRISLEKNGRHGEKLTRLEKQGAVKRLLAIPEMRRMSDKRLSALATVSPALIAKMREVVAGKESPKKPADAKPPASNSKDSGSSSSPRSVTAHERKLENAKPTKMETFDEKLATIKTWLNQGFIDYPAIITATETKAERLILVPKVPSEIQVLAAGEEIGLIADAVVSVENGKIRIGLPKGTEMFHVGVVEEVDPEAEAAA